jgi:hypothetical protein
MRVFGFNSSIVVVIYFERDSGDSNKNLFFRLWFQIRCAMGLPEEPFLICLFLKHTVLLTIALYKVIHIDPVFVVDMRYAPGNHSVCRKFLGLLDASPILCATVRIL